jgi:hypothetical protein
MSSLGDFVVLWVESNQIHSRRYDAAGNALEDARNICLTPISETAAIVRNASGDTAIVWRSWPDPGGAMVLRMDLQGDCVGIRPW